MNDPLLKKVKLKSPEEIIARARDIISRHRRRFLSRNLNPCPGNCAMADMMGRKITGCSGCGTIDPNKCIHPEKFQPAYSKEELAKQFAAELRDPGVLLRDYRDVVVFFWVLGAFDEEKQVDEEIVANVETRGQKPVRNPSSDAAPVPRDSGAGDSDLGAEPNYNRAESNYSTTDARLTGVGGKRTGPPNLPNRAKGAKQP
jgi:hypothetical protein